jgi:hypothetical protein
MRLSQFIIESSERIIAEWEVFARSCLPAANAMDLEERRDHVAGMLKAISRDLETPQTKREQSEKALGNDDANVDSHTASTAHGSERAASGYTAVQMVSEWIRRPKTDPAGYSKTDPPSCSVSITTAGSYSTSVPSGKPPLLARSASAS